MKLYKVLTNGQSQLYAMRWSLPQGEAAGDWHEVQGELVPCKNGLHFVTEPNIYRWVQWDSEVYEVETEGELIEHTDSEFGQKFVARKARLVRQHPHIPQWLEVKTFVASIEDIPFLTPDGNPRPEWKVFQTWEAAWEATWEATWEAARDAARDAIGDAIWDAAREAAWEAAREATWNAAREAAIDAIGDAIWDAAREAAWEAALMATCILTRDKIEARHYDHAVARWEVWQKGYSLVSDVDGILYVYEKDETR